MRDGDIYSKCDTAVERLKKGPVNIPELIYNSSCSGDKWTDEDFDMQNIYDVLYYDDYEEVSVDVYYQNNIYTDKFIIERWIDVEEFNQTQFFSSETLNYNDPKMNIEFDFKNGYFLAAISSVIVYQPDVIKDLFVTGTSVNNAGIYGI